MSTSRCGVSIAASRPVVVSVQVGRPIVHESPPSDVRQRRLDDLARVVRLLRVPTRSVLTYTLTRRPEASGAHEAVEGGPGHAGDLGDGGLGDTQLEEAADLVLLAVEP